MGEDNDIGIYKGRYRYCKDCEKLKNHKKTLIYFETEEELSEMTGLNHDELWENGFNLDDWDFGFAIDVKFTIPWWLDHVLENATYSDREITDYNGVRYIMYYHS